ncbi:MAG: DUF2062 domain-containing protein [Kiritimatiellae bacterium]|nr:DUF2062 domain-containing protein [Kiritimatiellia bacterium]
MAETATIPEKPLRRRKLRDHARIFLRSRGTPEQVAWGAVIGVMVGLTPLMGIHLPIAILLAWIFRASRLATLPGVFITNLVTALPIYTFTYRIGHRLLPGMTEHDIRPALTALLHSLKRLDWYAFPDILRALARISGEAMLAMLIGGFLVGAVASVPVWWITRQIVQRWRHRRKHRLNKKALEWFRKHMPHSPHHRIADAPSPAPTVPPVSPAA